MSLTFNATFGLMPGYGEFTYQPHHHDAVVGSAVRAAIAAVYAQRGVVVGCVVTPARVFYPPEFGCPENGETVVAVSGVHVSKFGPANEWREAVEALVGLIRDDLKQERVTLTFSDAAVVYMEPDLPDPHRPDETSVAEDQRG